MVSLAFGCAVNKREGVVVVKLRLCYGGNLCRD